jgi:hypothetical protein
MIRKRLPGILVLVLVLLAFCPAGSPSLAQEQGPITVTDSVAQIDFPLTLNFSALVKSTARINDVRLRYQVEQTSFASVTSEVYIPFSPASTVKINYGLDLKKLGGLPPGTNIDFWWVIKDSADKSLKTDAQRYQIMDNRYNWHSISEDMINLYWYQGSDSFAHTLVDSAQTALANLSKDTGAAPSQPINIYIYASASDLQGAMIYPNEWTGGVAYVQYNSIVIGVAPGEISYGKVTVVHELTHMVIYQVTNNPYSGLPVWLNEGLAMYNQGALSSQFTGYLNNAIKSHSLISVRSLCSPFSAYTGKATLSYAEAYAIVDYLLEKYGSTQMQALFDTFKQGSTYDNAFQTVYGFNIDELNTQWQTWMETQSY